VVDLTRQRNPYVGSGEELVHDGELRPPLVGHHHVVYTPWALVDEPQAPAGEDRHDRESLAGSSLRGAQDAVRRDQCADGGGLAFSRSGTGRIGDGRVGVLEGSVQLRSIVYRQASGDHPVNGVLTEVEQEQVECAPDVRPVASILMVFADDDPELELVDGLCEHLQNRVAVVELTDHSVHIQEQVEGEPERFAQRSDDRSPEQDPLEAACQRRRCAGGDVGSLEIASAGVHRADNTDEHGLVLLQ
jgi:hypothetical protein